MSRFTSFAIVLGLLCPQSSRAQPEPATATLPLAEVLRLHRETDEAAEPKPTPLPVRATVARLILKGRLLEEAIDYTARIEVRVLADDSWVEVPLLKKARTTRIAELPELENAVLAVRGDYLTLVTNHKGAYDFSVSVLEEAGARGQQRLAEIGFSSATLAVLHLDLDEGLFRLAGPTGRGEAPSRTVYPHGNRFVVTWEQHAAADRTTKLIRKRPPIESTVQAAHASFVTTLEGRRIIRVLYELRFEGTKPIQFTIPEGQTLQKVYLNGSAIPFVVKKETLGLEVTPARAGDQSGTLELVLKETTGPFSLSGSRGFRVARALWPMSELFLDLHLPGVFNYQQSGGSLAPHLGSPPVAYTYAVPEPGKRFSFHQYLIAATTPSVTMDYTVDLTDNLYR